MRDVCSSVCVCTWPWRAPQALNTFIDDLFAFIIKMPTMHRLSCLRDDVIFVVYLYQRYARVRLLFTAHLMD